MILRTDGPIIVVPVSYLGITIVRPNTSRCPGGASFGNIATRVIYPYASLGNAVTVIHFDRNVINFAPVIGQTRREQKAGVICLAENQMPWTPCVLEIMGRQVNGQQTSIAQVTFCRRLIYFRRIYQGGFVNIRYLAVQAINVIGIHLDIACV